MNWIQEGYGILSVYVWTGLRCLLMLTEQVSSLFSYFSVNFANAGFLLDLGASSMIRDQCILIFNLFMEECSCMELDVLYETHFQLGSIRPRIK
jgi:hypothetical protein